jgi:hypothetical protein
MQAALQAAIVAVDNLTVYPGTARTGTPPRRNSRLNWISGGHACHLTCSAVIPTGLIDRCFRSKSWYAHFRLLSQVMQRIRRKLAHRKLLLLVHRKDDAQPSLAHQQGSIKVPPVIVLRHNRVLGCRLQSGLQGLGVQGPQLGGQHPRTHRAIAARHLARAAGVGSSLQSEGSPQSSIHTGSQACSVIALQIPLKLSARW